MQRKLLGIMKVDLDATDKLLIHILRSSNSNTMKQCLRLYSAKKAYYSVRREVLYNILIESGIPMKLIRLIKMCLPAMYSRVQVGKNLSDMFCIRNGWKQGNALSSLLFNFVLEYTIMMVQVNQNGLKLNEHINFWFMLMMLIYWKRTYY